MIHSPQPISQQKLTQDADLAYKTTYRKVVILLSSILFIIVGIVSFFPALEQYQKSDIITSTITLRDEPENILDDGTVLYAKVPSIVGVSFSLLAIYSGFFVASTLFMPKMTQLIAGIWLVSLSSLLLFYHSYLTSILIALLITFLLIGFLMITTYFIKLNKLK